VLMHMENMTLFILSDHHTSADKLKRVVLMLGVVKRNGTCICG
jgi:hypothetical protein